MEYSEEEKEKVIEQMASSLGKRIVKFLDALNKRDEALKVKTLQEVNQIYFDFLHDKMEEGSTRLLELVDQLHGELMEWYPIYKKTAANWGYDDNYLSVWIREHY